LLRLFELEPDQKRLFAFTKDTGRGEDEYYNTAQFRHKSRSILKMIDLTVGLAGRDLDTVVHLCQELGVRHVGFGVSSCHYNAFGIALIYAIETVSGDSWNPKVQEGWTTIYEIISTAMMDGGETVIKDDDDDQRLQVVGRIKQLSVSNKQIPTANMSGPETVIKAETPASGGDRRQFMALASREMSESKLHSPYHRNMERRPSTGKPRTRRSCERTPTAKAAPRRKVKSPMQPSTSPVAGDEGGKRQSARARLAVDLAMDLSGHSGHSISAHSR
jgi:hemoglobin-like flavoprotein